MTGLEPGSLRIDNLFDIDTGHSGARIHDCVRFAGLHLLQLGNARVKSGLSEMDLGIVEGASFCFAKQFLLSGPVLLEGEAGDTGHVSHALWGFVYDLESTVVQGVGVVLVLAGDLRAELSRRLQMKAWFQDFPEIGLDAESSRAFVFDQVMSLTLEDCLVMVALTLPIVNLELGDSWKLLLVGLHSNLFSVRQVHTGVILTRLR